MSFSINRETGALTKLPGTPTVFAEGTSPLTLDRTGKLLYLSTGGSEFIYGAYSAIHGYRIAGNGHLIPLPGSPYQVTGGNLAVDPFNRFLYALNSPGYPNTGTVAVYRIKPNGSLSSVPGSPFPTGVDSSSIAVDPFGRFIYVSNFDSKTVSVYSVPGNGTLLPVPGSPFYTGKYSLSLVAESTGRFLYVASNLEVSISAYQVAANGVLTQALGSPTLIGTPWCQTLGYNPVGGYLYLLIGISEFSTFHINPVTGLPDPLQGISVGNYFDNNPVGICVSPNGKFVYEGNANGVVEPGPMTLRGFKVGPTGILTLVSGSPYYPLGNTLDPAKVEATEGWPSSMVVAP